MNHRPIWLECKNCLCKETEHQVKSADAGRHTITYRCVGCGDLVTKTEQEIDILTSGGDGSIMAV